MVEGMARPRGARTRVAATSEESQEQRTDIGGLTAAVRAVACSLAAIAVRFGPLRMKPDNERILSLYMLGFDRYEIAGILGTTPETVSVRLSEARARRSRR